MCSLILLFSIFTYDIICFQCFKAKIQGTPISSSRSSTVYDQYGEVIASTDDGNSTSSNYSLGQKFGALIFATVAMILYGYKINVVRFPRQQAAIQDHENDEEYYEDS